MRIIFAQPDPHSTRAHLGTVADTLHARFPQVAELLLAAEADVTAYADFPRAHHRKIASTNPLERVNKGIKRRSNVVGIFPDDASVIRLVGAVLLEVHDDWQTTDRRYLSEGSMRHRHQGGNRQDTRAPGRVTCRDHVEEHTPSLTPHGGTGPVRPPQRASRRATLG